MGASPVYTRRMRTLLRFSGDDVATIVAACSDSTVEDRNDKLPWWERKVAYLDHLAHARTLAPDVRFEVERYLGLFPDKGADAEKMKLYAADFARLAASIAARKG